MLSAQVITTLILLSGMSSATRRTLRCTFSPGSGLLSTQNTNSCIHSQYPVTHLQDTNRYAPVKLSIHLYYRGKFVALVAGTCTADTLSTSILAFITSDQKLDFDMNLDELDLCMFHRFRASRQRRHGHARSSTFGDIFADGQTA